MPWLQLIIDTQRDHAASLESLLLSNGAASLTFKEYIPKGQRETPVLEPELGETPLWDHARLIGLFDAKCSIHSINQQLHRQAALFSHYRWEPLEDKDWERAWMDNYHPIQCSDKLWICPSWHQAPDPSAANLLLDPGLAFGTGTHPSTFLCLQWLSKQQLNHSQLIDYGCGSGILGIAALLLGAEKVTGIDIDPQALIATRENVTRNKLRPEQFTVYLAQPSSSPPSPLLSKLSQADIVMANILAGPIVELACPLIEKLKIGGRLCLSGVLHTQAEQVIKAYKPHIDFADIAQKEEWICLSGQRVI